jgi:hypothetical protein
VPVCETLEAIRVVARSDALDQARWPGAATVLRLAPDEVLVIGADRVEVGDPHAIVARDHGYCGVSLGKEAFREWFEREAAWPVGGEGFAQGQVAGLPVKVWQGEDVVLVVTRSSLRHELEARL